MSKKPITTKTHDLAPLITELRRLINSARHAAATTVNTLQVMTNFEIGRRIVEHEQKGAERAEYGKELLKELSLRLSEEFGKGFSLTNLKLMRQFSVEYRDRIGQQATDQSKIAQRTSGQSPFNLPFHTRKFTLNWTHYVLLLTIKNPEERSFYEIESTQSGWSVPELKRQVSSCLYERLALSRDKEGVQKLAHEGQIIIKPEEMLKEPYVLEFLGLDEKAGYSESEYQLYLPSKELLRQKLLDWALEQDMGKQQ